jgi:hypothetical protein
MARGLMLKAATVDQTGDGTAYPSEASKKRMATDWPNAGCCHRSFLIDCSVKAYLTYKLGIVKLH